MKYLDPATWPEHVLQAWIQQSQAWGVHPDRALGVARLCETLRSEVDDAPDQHRWFRLGDLAEQSTMLLASTVEKVADDITAYAEIAMRSGKLDTVALADYAARQMSVRLIYALLLSLEVDTDGNAQIREGVFQSAVVGPRGEALVEDDTTEQEHLRGRTNWIVRAIIDSEYRNLIREERDYVEKIERQGDDELITPAQMSTLEYLLCKAQPHYALFVPGTPRLNAILRGEARRQIPALLSSPTVSAEDRAALTRVRDMADDDVGPALCAHIMRIAIAEERRRARQDAP